MAGKEHIRRELLAERRRRWADGRGDPAAVWARVAGLPQWQGTGCVAAYMATPGEVELDGLIQALLRDSRPVWLPRFDAGAGRYDMVRIAALGEDLQTGAFGIREPRAALPAVPPDERSGSGVVWLVPGVAFDLAGHRLGRGRGYYDRLLRGARGVRIGVAWDWQVIAQVPHTDHDEAMHWIVTETRTIACRGSAG